MSDLLNLEGTLKIVFDKAVSLCITIVVSLIIYYIGKTSINKLIKRYSKNKDNPQVATLLTILQSLWKYFVLLISFIGVLNVFGLGITANSLLAAAGAGGLVLGIGAQDFVKDIVNGFTIIMENHFSVGDRVIINGQYGLITNMTLRTTEMVGERDEVLMIPNSAIGTVINYSRQSPKVFCYIYIIKQEDVPNALKTIKLLLMEYKGTYAVGTPELLGVTGMFPYGVQVGVSCNAAIGHILDLKYDIYSAVAAALLEENICFCGEKPAVTVEGGDCHGV